MDGVGNTEVERSKSKPSAVYPYLKGHFGIPLNELKTPIQDEIITGSGRKVFCDIGEDDDIAWVRIEDNKDHYIMHINLKGDTVAGEIHTRKKNGERHPDFFAKNFLAFALNHFAQQGYSVRRFKAMWAPVESGEWGSDNYEDYQRLIQEGKTPDEAAKETWTGKVLSQLGFVEVESVQSVENFTIALFKKPDQNPLPE